MRALGTTDADVERARRAEGYRRCLYGTRESGQIVGLPAKETERPSFIQTRRADCADARAISETALVEMNAIDPSLDDGQRITKTKQFFENVDLGFEENVLRPDAVKARRKALEECIETKGAGNC